MRGRLPENTFVQSHDLASIHVSDPSTNPSEEEITIEEHLHEVELEIHQYLLHTAEKIAPYTTSQRELHALMGIARIIQQDMRVLQGGLSRAGRPPDQRDGEYIPAPDWDTNYLVDLVSEWDEPVLLESDFYLLRSMCLYELGTSVQVKVLGPDKVRKYMEMALALAQKAYKVLKTVLGQSDDASDKYWRYQTFISYIQQRQTTGTIDEISDHESAEGFPASDQLYEKARQQLSQALRSFDHGIKFYPSVSKMTEESFKSQEWSKIAALADSYTQLTDEFLSRQMWIKHTVRLLKGGLLEDKTNCSLFLHQISNAYLSFALWIHEQPEKPLLLVPRVSPMFHEMQCAAVAALAYAKHAMENMRDEDLGPDHYCQIIDSLYMVSLVCISPHLIHAYSRKATYWINQFRLKFPNHKIEPSYLHSARLMDAKDKAMQAIAQRRQDQ
ncbi:hypothetical protein EDD21DRAFT_437142 [Dissophora ornata]|nr:hypothetical protein BGZ58_004963 [Dissophora ornata]KAI8606433.1 hypothetical protein EDD21DRAFT_437142 [Dissophora ornata]